ncbi:MAG: hypothetical protein GY792_09355 [Gammaproteobacteria bacterium]|nr:hypothetical protein [Gammaproteobacteria bacterium]
MTAQNNQKTIQMRPTLAVGLGGTGHRVMLRLKSLVRQNWKQEQMDTWIKFLVLDTAQEDLAINHNGTSVKIEPSSEFLDIGQTPVANIKRNLARQSAIEERLGSVMAGLPPTVLRNGAKQLRPLGLLALLWRYADVETHLRDAIWALAHREHNERREGINVFIVNSLVGGTGSSAFLDVAHVIRDLFDELGTLADFCYITGVGVLPRAFHGINGPNLIPNAVASLTELNHCMMRSGFKARYPNGRVIQTVHPPFDVYYLVDGIDERGHTWSGPNEVYRLAAEAIFLQMGSQVGQKHENDFDNLDDVLVQQTEEGDGTFYGSFGLASLVFPGRAVAQSCTTRQARRVIAQGLLAPANSPADEAQATPQPVAEIIAAAGLQPEQLTERLGRDDEGLPLTVELTVPGWAGRLSPASLPGELVRYVRNYEQARLGIDYKRWLTQNEAHLADQSAAVFTDRLTRLVQQAGLPAAEDFLTRLLNHLVATVSQLNARQADRDSRQSTLAQELDHLETAFLQAGESNFLVRKQRVTRARQAYFTTAQELFSLRWRGQLSAAMLTIFQHVTRVVQDDLAACLATATRLKAVQRTLADMQNISTQDPGLAGVTTQSLATTSLVDRLFEQHVPPISDVLATLFSQGESPLDWHNLPPTTIQDRLLAACEPAFAPIAAMGVEQAIVRQADQNPPENYHTWLMTQATPSWNLDRARLPNGGTALHRLEVLGVPDESSSLYGRHATSLVSTGDLSRITAFAAHIGAPHTAIQQWDSYQAAYDQARGHVPLHILSHFQVDNERARQTFALGPLFGFIKSQGAYFYYVPVDTLARPVKLAQGLANSLQAFTSQAGLVQEARERIEQIVATRGVEATLKRLSQYYEQGNGRYPADDLILELKRLVRAYADELRQIHQFAPANWASDEDTEEAHVH